MDTTAPSRPPRPRWSAASVWRPYLGGLAAVTVATVLAFPLQRLPHANLSLVFLTATLVAAARWGLGPSLATGALGFLSYIFFFTPPAYSFLVDEEGDVATLVFFLCMAALTGQLAARMRGEKAKTDQALKRISNLYDFSRAVSACASEREVLEELCRHSATSLSAKPLVLFPDGEGRLRATHGEAIRSRRPDPEAASAAWNTGAHQVRGWTFYPLTTTSGSIGLLAAPVACVPPERDELTRSMCDQAAIALDRIRLVQGLEDARVVAEREQMRSALLSSVSHDLRTPLASIVGSTSSVIEYADEFDASERRELLQMVLDEAGRLDRYIQNLLDMTRLGQGELTLQKAWVDLHDLIAGAVQRMVTILPRQRVQVELESGTTLLHVHGDFIEQALVNLLDNAVRFSPPAAPIEIHARREGEWIEIDVMDHGPGIPEAHRERVFDMFYRVEHGDRKHGTGLGLSICRGLLQAHGGEVEALDRPDGKPGACLRLRLRYREPDRQIEAA